MKSINVNNVYKSYTSISQIIHKRKYGKQVSKKRHTWMFEINNYDML